MIRVKFSDKVYNEEKRKIFKEERSTAKRLGKQNKQKEKQWLNDNHWGRN